MKANALSLAVLVDELASVNAKIAELQNLASEIKSVLIESNQRDINGLAYKAVVGFIEPKPSVDYKQIVLDLVSSGELKANVLARKGYQKVRVPYYAVSLYDR